MRRRLAAVVLFAFVASAPAASATLLPPTPRPHAQPLKLFTIARPAPLRIERTCMFRSKLARRLAPVACEQPPRSELLIATLIAF